MNITSLKMLFGIATLLFTVAVLGKADAQTAAETWQVEVDINSGQPNPVFTLTSAELADVKSRLGSAKSVAGASPNIKTIRPSILGYRGLTVTGKSGDGTQTTGDVEVYKGKILRRAPGPAAVLDDSTVGLERQLLALGMAKKAISNGAMQEIQKSLP
jgi:hypothetical protein